MALFPLRQVKGIFNAAAAYLLHFALVTHRRRFATHRRNFPIWSTPDAMVADEQIQHCPISLPIGYKFLLMTLAQNKSRAYLSLPFDGTCRFIKNAQDAIYV